MAHSIISGQHPLPSMVADGTRVMMFIDGENLAIRYGETIGSGNPADHAVYSKDVYVWTQYANLPRHTKIHVIRKYYYTCLRCDEDKRMKTEEDLKNAGIEAPVVLKKASTGRSKKVDISLAVDMVGHAFRDNYDIAILVSGDEDFVPVVEAVKLAGKRVVLWSMESGLSNKLKIASDHYFRFDNWMKRTKDELQRTWLSI